MNPSLSLCVTVKDEGKFTNKIYDFQWRDNFSKARNFSIKKATKDWILVLDPDEKIAKNDLIKLRETIKKEQEKEGARARQNNILGYRLIQKTYYKNRVISIRGICRLFKIKLISLIIRILLFLNSA